MFLQSSHVGLPAVVRLEVVHSSGAIVVMREGVHRREPVTRHELLAAIHRTTQSRIEECSPSSHILRPNISKSLVLKQGAADMGMAVRRCCVECCFPLLVLAVRSAEAGAAQQGVDRFLVAVCRSQMQGRATLVVARVLLHEHWVLNKYLAEIGVPVLCCQVKEGPSVRGSRGNVQCIEVWMVAQELVDGRMPMLCCEVQHCEALWSHPFRGPPKVRMLQ
mmetsp:Transcript_60499/g.132424  ORF Transcript_60499/g.132424 Transcript_60499/m.132424 type:complete len:220 (+) Transcript_60499:1198-1857(+)